MLKEILEQYIKYKKIDPEKLLKLSKKVDDNIYVTKNKKYFILVNPYTDYIVIGPTSTDGSAGSIRMGVYSGKQYLGSVILDDTDLSDKSLYDEILKVQEIVKGDEDYYVDAETLVNELRKLI